MSNLLIVEAENDATFIKSLVKYSNNQVDNTDTGYMTLNFEERGKTYRGLSKDSLKERLTRVQIRLQKELIHKIGIILDKDSESKADRLKLINDCIQAVFPEAETITDTHQLKTLTTIDEEIISIACYFVNVGGQGELETLLRRIKNHESSIADCLERCLVQCLEDYPREINQKNLDKTWIVNYLRYDTCRNNDKGDRDKKCSFNAEGFKYIMEHKSDIWNFEDPALDELKRFLALFS
ncbi:MAG: DUF3226 domain-containing protein [Microcystaceae cyanobacterium]